MTRPEPTPELTRPHSTALDPRFGLDTEVRLAELRRLIANLRAAEEIRAGTWPVWPQNRR